MGFSHCLDLSKTILGCLQPVTLVFAVAKDFELTLATPNRYPAVSIRRRALIYFGHHQTVGGVKESPGIFGEKGGSLEQLGGIITSTGIFSSSSKRVRKRQHGNAKLARIT